MNELWSDDNLSATNQNIKIVGMESIDLVPNKKQFNDVGSLVLDASNKVICHGNLEVLGGVDLPTVTVTSANYSKDNDTVESGNAAITSKSAHLVLKGVSSSYEVIAEDSRLVAHKPAHTADIVTPPDAFAVRCESGNENFDLRMGFYHNSGLNSGNQTGATDWRAQIDAGTKDLEVYSGSQARVTAADKVRLAANNNVEIVPKTTVRGEDPDSKMVVTFNESLESSSHAYATNATILTVASKGGASNKGEHLWITGDTAVSGSSVAVEHVKFTDAAITTSRDALSLSGATAVNVNSDLVLTKTGGSGGKLTTSVGGLELTSASGEINVTGNLNVTGTYNSVNTVTTTVQLQDKLLALGTPADVTVSYWPFDAGTPATDTVAAVSMSITGAVLANQRLEVTAAGHNASASSASWPYGSVGVQVSANVTPVSALPTSNSFLLAYGSIGGVYLRLYYHQASDKLILTDGVYTATTTNAALLTAGTAAKIVVRRDPTTSSVSLLVNSVPQVLVGGGAGHLSALGALSFASTPTLYLGHFGADASAASFYFDNVRVESVTKATNAASDSAGIMVQGDGAVAGVDVERSIKWNAGVSASADQDKGDYTGSYWEIKGGQLVLTRSIDPALRKAPGSSILLSTLPSSTLEKALWTFGSGLGSDVGSLTLVAQGTTPASVAGGVLKTNNTAQGNGAVSVTDAGTVLPLGTTNITVVATVQPKTALNVAGANGLEILSYGDNNQIGGFLRVTVSSAGKLSVTDGSQTNETAEVVVGSNAFVLGLQLDTGAPKLFINGVLRAWTVSNVSGVNILTRRLSLGSKTLTTVTGYDIWYDDVRVASSLLSGDSQLYRYSDEYDAAPLTVSYAFRIADDESIQLVKWQGSDSSNLVLGNPRPANDAGVNLMPGLGNGASDLAATDVVFEALNKP
eukprot:jgi/Mesvir1/25363/Mv01465-RA.1